MTLTERIEQDYVAAVKNRESETVATLRLIKSSLKNEAIKIGGLGYELSDQEATAVLSREVKQRNDAASQYETAGRPELAEKEKQEIAIIEQYLPKALSDEELQSIVDEVLASTGATEKAHMGKVMAELKGKLANPADAARAAQIVAQKLS